MHRICSVPVGSYYFFSFLRFWISFIFLHPLALSEKKNLQCLLVFYLEGFYNHSIFIPSGLPKRINFLYGIVKIGSTTLKQPSLVEPAQPQFLIKTQLPCNNIDLMEIGYCTEQQPTVWEKRIVIYIENNFAFYNPTSFHFVFSYQRQRQTYQRQTKLKQHSVSWMTILPPSNLIFFKSWNVPASTSYRISFPPTKFVTVYWHKCICVSE